MYKIELVRYALANQCDDTTVYKIQKIKEHYLEIIHDGELLYNFKDKDEACQYLTDLLIAKSADDVLILDNNDRDLIKLVLENRVLFDKNTNVLGDIKEKAKLFDKTVFEFKTIEDYKAALEEFVMDDNAMSVDDSDETLNMEMISDMLDDEFDALCDMEQREMLNGKQLPTKPKYAIVERTLGIGATDWDLFKENRMTYGDLGSVIDIKPSNYSQGFFSKEFEIVNLSDPKWKQTLNENDDNEYFVMRRELTHSGCDATDWEIDSDIFETWNEAKSNMPKDYGNFQFIIASRPKEKDKKTVETRRRLFNFGD